MYQDDVWTLVRSVSDDVNTVMKKTRVDKVVVENLDTEVFIHVPDVVKKKNTGGPPHQKKIDFINMKNFM